MKAAKQLVELWPHAKPANPDVYVAGLAALLGSYPPAIVMECVDPLHGLAPEREFPPTLACVKEWCERRKAAYESASRIEDWQIASLNRPPEPEFSEEHCAAMREKIAAIPRDHFKRMQEAAE